MKTGTLEAETSPEFDFASGEIAVLFLELQDAGIPADVIGDAMMAALMSIAKGNRQYWLMKLEAMKILLNAS